MYKFNAYQEIDNYLAADFSDTLVGSNDSDDIDLLLFWRRQQHSYPILSSIAKVGCAIPASNTIVERLFSAAKNVVTDKRTRLDCEKINQMLFLQKNMKALKQLFNNDPRRKRTVSTASTATSSSSFEELACTSPKLLRLEIEDITDEYDKGNIIDCSFLFFKIH